MARNHPCGGKNPGGIGISKDDELFFTDNQGDWDAERISGRMASTILADRLSASRAVSHERVTRGGSSRKVRGDRPWKAASCVEWKSSEYENRWMVGNCSFGLVPCPGRAGELPDRRDRCRGMIVPSCVRWTRNPRSQASRLVGRSVERCFHLELLVKVMALIAWVHEPSMHSRPLAGESSRRPMVLRRKPESWLNGVASFSLTGRRMQK